WKLENCKWLVCGCANREIEKIAMKNIAILFSIPRNKSAVLTKIFD
ncbi:hypothetical protein MNBD_BACTEROID05-926, partial [hydrothermal vent metagenome]